MEKATRNVKRVNVQAKGTLLTEAKVGAESSKKGANSHQGVKHIATFLLAMVLIMTMAIGGGLSVFADSMATAQDTYNPNNQIKTANDANMPNGVTYDDPVYNGPFTVNGVHQSASTTSGTTFAAPMPLSTIYIDMDVMNNQTPVYKKLASASDPLQADFADGIGDGQRQAADGNSVKNYGYYDPSLATKKLYAYQDNYLPGNLFSYTYKDAAFLADGSTADVLITYSNAHIFVDQRQDTAPLNATVGIASGRQLAYRTLEDAPQYPFERYATDTYNSRVTGSSDYPITYTAGSNATNSSNNRYPMVGGVADVRVQIVDSTTGKPIEGTFIMPTTGINLDRSPVTSGANSAKPLWYLNNYFPEYEYFSESIRINSGTASDIYLTSNEAVNEQGSTELGKQYYWPKVAEETSGVYQGSVKFTGRARYKSSSNGHDDTYSTGFVTTADAASGISVTGTGHGSDGYKMHTSLMSGKQIWHRIRSVTGPGGNIQTTSEGNKGGTLDDKADNGDDAAVLGQGTYVVPDGKTVIYTMTPNRGYVLKELRISDSLTGVSAPISGVDTMDAGDIMTVPVDTGKNVTITKLADGSYTAEFPENNANHTIMVTWIPDTTENVSVDATKKWYDKNNQFNTRGGEVVVHVNGYAKYASNEVHEYPQDFLPAQKEAAGTVADGNEAWTIKWGDGETNSHSYTGAVKSETVYDKLSSLPQQIGGSTAYYFYDYNTRQFRGYTYNTTTGKFEATDNYFWVNFLPKYDETGNTITYTVEEDVPNGYSVTTVVNNSGAASTTMADFDYTLMNVLEPVGTVNVKATKALKGRPFNGTDEFTFVLAGLDGAPMPVNTAVQLPAQGEDVPKEVAKTITPAANTVLAEADFGVISYRKSDLTPTKVTYGTTTAQTPAGYVKANDEQKAAIRFWTVHDIPRIVDKIDKNGNLIYEKNGKEFRYNPNSKKLYNDAGDEVTNFDLNDYTRAKATLYSDRTFDMLTPADVTAFGQLDTGLQDAATATAYEGLFKYTLTENPRHPNYVENDTETHNMSVRVFYNEKENKLYIDDEEVTTTPYGVTDITAETTTALTTPSYTLHRDFFTNAYDNKVGWDPEITKILNGRPIKADQFKDYFTIKAVDTAESINVQVKDKVADTETPMPGDANATTGVYPHGGTANSKTQEIKSATSAPQGTNEVKGIVGFDTITYTNDDLLKEINYDGATDDQKNRVIKWVKGSNVYGPIPGNATASATLANGSTGTVTYDNATDAQRKEVAAAGNGWVGTDGTYFDITQATPADLSGSKGYYYLDSRTFTYKIWESGTAKEGYTNDPAHDTEAKAYVVEVTVTRDNTTGKLSVSADKTVDNLLFENKYKANGNVTITVKKEIEGRDLVADEFEFEIERITPGAPLPVNSLTAKNKADGTVEFNVIEFNQEHLKKNPSSANNEYDAVRTVDGFYEKTFLYKIIEKTTDGSGVTTDKSTKIVAVTVREDEKGNISVVAVNGNTDAAGDTELGTGYSVEAATATAATKSTVKAGKFTNEYTASGSTTITANKVLNGGKLEENQFYFTLGYDGGAILGTVGNASDGSISFPMVYNLDQVQKDAKDGICTTADTTAPDNGKWTYTYKMKELKVDGRGTDDITYDARGTGAGYTVTVEVTDDGKGNLTPEIKSSDIVFTNTVKTRDLTLTKIWIDNDADGISKVTRPDSVILTVTANVADEDVLSSAAGTEVTKGWTVDAEGGMSTKNFTLTKAADATSANDAVWRKSIENLPRYKADGTAITYTVDELNANVPTNYKKSVISAANTVVNTYTLTSISGTKIWVDGGKAHAISADLDGKLTVKWTDANGGSGTVTKPHIDYDNATSEYNVIGLPKYSDNGALRTYYVEETQLDGYKAPAYDNSASTDTTLTEAQKEDTSKAYNGGKITNTITGTVDVTGNKVWIDGDQTNVNHPTPTLTLTRISAKPGSAEETMMTDDATPKPLQPTWNSDKTSYEYVGLDKYDADGYEYTYKVTEGDVAGFLPPTYSQGTYAANGGTITNVVEPIKEFDLDVKKVFTNDGGDEAASTRIEDWDFEVQLRSDQNGTGTQVYTAETTAEGGTVEVPAGTLSEDGKSETSTVSFTGLRAYIGESAGTVQAAIYLTDGTGLVLEDKGDGVYTGTIYARELPIADNKEGLTQPAADTKIDITLKNNGDGTMTVTTNPAVAEIKNTHEKDVSVPVAVKKTLNGRDLKADDNYTFTATYVPDTTLPEAEQARLADALSATSFTIPMSQMARNGKVATGNINITIEKTGTYKFKVTESGTVPGVTNDAKATTGEEVTITVTKDTDGSLKATTTYGDGTDADFTNTYDATGDVTLRVRKAISGASWEDNMAFWFKLEPKTAPDGYTLANMPKPEVDLEPAYDKLGRMATWTIEGFTLEDVGKEFVYSVVEQEPSFTGYDSNEWVNDKTEHTITIIPVDNGNGTLSFTHKHDGVNAASDAALTITNRKKGTAVNVFAHKSVVNADGHPYWPASLGSFDIVFTAVDGGPMPSGSTGNTKTMTATNAEALNFDTIDFDREYADLEASEEKTFTYTFTEVTTPAKPGVTYGIDNTGTYTIEIKIAKDASGQNIDPVITRKNAAGVDVTSAGYPVIKNKYEAEGEVTLELTKNLVGTDLAANQFSFTLYDAEKNVVEISDGTTTEEIKGKKNNDSGKVSLATLKFTEADIANSPFTYNIREDIPVGAKAQDDESIVYAADTTLEVRDAHVWVKDGIVYDPAITHPVTITVADNHDGTLNVTASTANVSGEGETLTVTNTYTAEGTQTFKVFKYLEERPIKRAGFTFQLKGIDGAPMPAGVTGDTTTTQVLPSATYSHSGEASFANIVYTMDDLKEMVDDDDDPSTPDVWDGTYAESKTFKYEISEVVPTGTDPDGATDGLDYANTVYTATVTVSNASENGELAVSVSYAKKSGDDSKYGDNEGDAKDSTYGANGTVDFTNVYDSDGEAALNLTKTLLGRQWQDNDQFTFVVEPMAGKSFVGGEDHKADVADNKVPLPGNTIGTDRSEPGNAGATSETTIKGTDTKVGAQSRTKATSDIKFTDDMLNYDSTDGILKGSFFYKITEKTPLPAGFTQTANSTTTYYARVDVTDDRMGNISTVVTYYDKEAMSDSDIIANVPTFSNTYDAKVENVKIPVTKYVDVTGTPDGGWTLLEDTDKFSFKATPVGAAPAVTDDDIEIAKTTADHTNSFNIAKIELADLLSTTATAGQLTYSDGTTAVPAGVSYGEFVGLVTEDDHNIKGVDKDTREVYVKVTAIDKLDSTIDTQLKFYSDISCTQEITDFTRSEAKDVEFVNVYRDVMDVEVQKAWFDGDKDDADRPDIKIQLTRQAEGGSLETLTSLDGNAKLYAADGTTEISYANSEATVKADQLPVTFKNVPAKDKSGNKYTYNIVETDAGTDYFESKDPIVVQEGALDDPSTTGVDETESHIIKLTNTMTTKVTVKKVWQDGGDTNNRGTVIVAGLYKNGILLPGNIKLVQSDSDPEWTTVFEEPPLPMYDESDEPITYTAKEMAVPAEYYTSLIEYSLTGAEDSWSTTLPDTWETAEDKYIQITNILLSTLEVEKEWAGIPTDNVTYELYRTIGTPDDIVDGDWDPTADNADGSKWEKVMSSDDTTPLTHTFGTEEFYDANGALLDPTSVKYTFTDIERYDKNGNEYTYRVFETTDGPYFESEQVSNVKVKNSNVYDGIGYANPNVVKELEGRRWLDTDKFYFKIEPIKSIVEDGDDKGQPIDFDESAEDQAAKAKVPLPDDGDDADEEPDVIAMADVSKKVGAIGRSVDFNRITFVSGDGEDAHVTEGGSSDYFYKIYEVDENGDAIGGETIDGITYSEDVHTLRIHLEDDGLGNVTTQRYWDGADTSSAVPVYVNKYKAYGISYGYVIKRIAGRDFEQGDEFSFVFTNLSGSPVRMGGPNEPGTTEPDERPVDPVGYPEDEGVYVSGDLGNYTATGENSGADKAQEVGINYINSGDLVAGTDGKLRGTFVYEFRELGGREGDNITKVENLEYDDNLIYLQVKVEDNEDGTLKVEHEYFLDAACQYRLAGREHHEPKLLVNIETGDIAPAGATEGTTTVIDPETGEEIEVTYGYVASGYFRNRLNGDIPAAKKWVDSEGNLTDPVDNATVNLYRMAVFVNPADGKYYNEYEDGVYSNPVTDAVLNNIGEWDEESSHVFEVGDFYYNASEAAAYNEEYGLSGDEAVSEGDLKEDAVDYVFENVELYEHNAEDGVPTGKIYIYRLYEATGSEAFTSTYRLGDSDTEIEDWTGTDTTGEKVTVVNKVEAKNVANIAAVKQLLGRDWLSTDYAGEEVDRYKFQLIPVGMGTYDANGKLVVEGGKVKMDETVGTDIPMPDSVISSELDSQTEKDKALAAKVTQFASGAVSAAEIVGEGERLARFGPITYTLDKLVYNSKDGYMHGDFFYTMKEEIPAGAVNAAGQTYGTEGASGPWTYKGVTYDEKTHIVHVRVRENRTKELVVQVAYDEKTQGDISTGTQYTPVFTNRYNAGTTPVASVDKYIMGRKWATGDEFTFELAPIGGAPTFASGDSITAKITVTDEQAGSADKLSAAFDFGTFKFKLEDLNKVTGSGGEYKYSEGDRDVPAGTPYGVFLYGVTEESATSASGQAKLDKDQDTEYIQYTVIDKGDGTLDIHSAIYEDRYATERRKVPGTNVDAESVAFVNQALRDIKVTKIWRGIPSADAVVTLQYGVPIEDADPDDEQFTWYDYETYTFKTTMTKAGDEADDVIHGLTVPVTYYEKVFTDLPVYEVDEDIHDLTDRQLAWRVVEQSLGGTVETYYGVTADIKYDERTNAEGYSEDADVASDPTIDISASQPKTVDDLDKDLYITNVDAPVLRDAKAKVSVVKDIKGREWKDTDAFNFKLTPVGIGTYDEDGKLYVEQDGTVDRSKLKKDGDTVITDIPMPDPDTATAKIDEDHPEYELTDSQWQTYFKDIVIASKNLALVEVDGEDVLKGDFFYDMTEVIPTTTDKSMTYDKSTHEVHVHVERVGDHLVATVSYNGKDAGGAVPVFTNRHEVVNKPVRISWVNDTDYDDTVGDKAEPESTAKDRPKEVTVTLQKKVGDNWVDVTDPEDDTKSWSVTLDKTNAKPGDPDNWFDDTFSSLPKYDESGDPINYRIAQTGIKYADDTTVEGTKTNGLTSSVIPNGYSSSMVDIDIPGTLTTILNAYQTVTISGTKVWVDPDGTKHNNSSDITLKVERSEDGNTWTTLTKDTDYHIDWSTTTTKDDTFTIRGLAKYVNADTEPKVEYQYKVTENAVSGYTTTYTPTGGSTTSESLSATGGTITNIINQDYVEVTVTKTWVGPATDDVVVELKSDVSDTALDTYTFAKNNDAFGETGGTATYKFTRDNGAGKNKGYEKYYLEDPQADNYGEEIVYTANETTTSDNFTTEYSEDKLTITNTNAEKVTIYAKKVWEGDEGEKSKREAVKFQLIKTTDNWTTTTKVGEPKAATETSATFEPITDADNNDCVVWEDLPKYADGAEVKYDVNEVSVPASYGMTKIGEGTEDKPFIITNTLGANETAVTITKVWDDNNNHDGMRPTDDEVTVTLSATSGTSASDATWDGKDTEGNDVSTVTLNEGNNGVARIEKLPAADSTGAPYTYKVEETPVSGYTTTYMATVDDTAKTDGTVGDDGKVVITNMRTDELIKVYASKDWTGEPDTIGDSMRPSKVTLHLYGLSEGKIVYDAGTKDITTPSEDEVVWENLPKYHYDNTALEWEIVEDAVFGYTPMYSQEADEDGNVTFVVTNAYTDPVSTIKVTKQWNDDDDVDGKRPDTIYYQLWKKVGNDGEKTKVGDPVEATKADDYKYTWTGLPTLDTTTVDEEREKTVVEEYEEPVTEDITPDGETEAVTMYAFDVDGITYYNTAEDGTGDWYDVSGIALITDDDQDPGYVDVSSAAPITETRTREKDETETVQVPVEQPIFYTVTEVTDKAPAGGKSLDELGYTGIVATTETAGEFQAINSRPQDMTDITVTKVWADGKNVDGGRPEHIEIILNGNGDEVRRAVLTGDMTADEWTITFENLPVNDEDGEIEYTADEANVPEGYEKTATGLTVTNSYTPSDPITLKVTKVWKDSEGNDLDSQPVEVELRLIRVIGGASKDMGDDQAKTIAADATGDDLTVEWTNLPSVVNGEAAQYTVEETPIEGYKASYEDGEYDDVNHVMTITVTNVKDPDPETITVTYKEPATFNDEILQGPDTILRDGVEPEAPEDPSHEGYTFTGWQRTEDANGNVTYTARYAEIPDPVVEVKVTYVDPKAGDGKMILKATKYGSQADADNAANKLTDKPSDPSHGGYDFVGWAANKDEFGDWILVAKYNDNVPVVTGRKTVSYIDPQSGKLIVSEVTDDEESVEPPAAPGHENMAFAGWERVVDAGGNVIYVAKYEAECQNPPKGGGSQAEQITTPDVKKPAAPMTGDEEEPVLWLGLTLAATVSVTFIRRRKKIS